MPTTQVERTAKALGAAITEDERSVGTPAPVAAAAVYPDIDGTGVPIRSAETEGRACKQEDSSAKTRESKLITLRTAESWTAEGRPQRGPGSVCFPAAAIESGASCSGTGPPRSGISPAASVPGGVRSIDLCYAKEKLRECRRALCDDLERDRFDELLTLIPG